MDDLQSARRGGETVKAALQFQSEVRHLRDALERKKQQHAADADEIRDLEENLSWYKERLAQCVENGLDIDPEDLEGLKSFLTLEDENKERGDDKQNYSIYGPESKASGGNSGGRILNLVVCGPGGVGKSAITVMFTSGHFIEEYDPTIEDNFRKQITVDNDPVVLEILDTAGQEEYKRMREMWMRPANGFLLVYAVDSLPAHQTLYEWHDQILRIKDSDSFPMILLGNKCDLPAQERTVTTKQGQELANKWNIPFLETSAKTHHNIDQAFYELVRCVRKFGGTGAQPGLRKSNSTGKTGGSGRGRRCTLF